MFVMTVVLLLAAGGDSVLAGQDPPPRPLTVGKIRIESRDIFSREEIESSSGTLAALQKAMNGIHCNTHEYVLRQELLFAEGDSYDPAALAETERNLRELGFLNNVHVTAVDTTADGRVDILVSARESWSLQANLAYARSSGGDTRWTVQLSDKNFLGHGATVGAGLGGDENSSYWNLWFRKRRLTALDLLVGVDYAERSDGHFRNFFLSRPFYAQDDSWSAGAGLWDSLADVRFYLSNSGPAGADPGRQASLYTKLPSRRQGGELTLRGRISRRDARRIWRLGAGVRVIDQDLDLAARSEWPLSDGRYADLDFLAGPGQPLAREQGVTVFPFLHLETLGRHWAKARFILQYGPVEDIPLDFSCELRTGPDGPAMGSSTGFGGDSWLTEVEFSRWLPAGAGFANLSGSGIWQAGARENRYYKYEMRAAWVGIRGNENQPWITRIFAEYAQGENLLGSQALLLGLGRGLRTLEFDGMAGDRLVRWNIEQGKATSWEVLGMFRLGGAVFYDGGCALWKGEDRSLSDLRHEVGCGLRLGPTRSAAAQVSRLDLSWALDGSVGPVFTATTRGFF